jgi:hypothetical protein
LPLSCERPSAADRQLQRHVGRPAPDRSSPNGRILPPRLPARQGVPPFPLSSGQDRRAFARQGQACARTLLFFVTNAVLQGRTFHAMMHAWHRTHASQKANSCPEACPHHPRAEDSPIALFLDAQHCKIWRYGAHLRDLPRADQEAESRDLPAPFP